MKSILIPSLKLALGLLCAFASSSGFSAGSNIIIPGSLTEGMYEAINGKNNKATAAVSGSVTSFKKGFHMGSSGEALEELDVEIKKGFTLNTGFYYNTTSPARSVADGATINIGNRVVDGERVFDEGTLQAKGGYSSGELWFRGEERAKNAVWHIGTQQELAMAGVRVDVEACNTVYLYNVSFRSNTQVNVDATSQLYMTFVDGVENRFGSSTLAGKFVFSTKPSGNNYVYLAGTTTISGQTTENASSFGSSWSKWRISPAGNVTISKSQTSSILLGTKDSGVITLDPSTLTLESSNALAANATNGQDKITLEISTNANSFSNSAKLILKADENGQKTTNSFAGVWSRGTSDKNVGSNLVITLNGNELIFGDVNKSNTANIGLIYITDFAEGLFKINTVASEYLGEKNKVTFLRAGTDTDYDDLYWDSSTGYITAIAVPEPSTYAAIFGALALGFVIYRRRK